MLRCRLHPFILDGGTASRLFIQGASSVDGPWTSVSGTTPPLAAGAVGETWLEMSCETDAQYKLYRYLRWMADSTGSNDSICFMIEMEIEE